MAKSMFYERNKVITICHGSDHIIKAPIWGVGEKTNDYGCGFYTVSENNKELSKEWACSPYNKSGVGFVNTYSFDTQGLRYLNLDDYDIIYWIVLTASHRNANVSSDKLNALKSKYFIDVSKYDCVFGWRCDDTYSNIINKFFDESFSSDAILEATRLGHLKEQFVLVSKESFERISFIDACEVKDFSKYRERFDKRKVAADMGLAECGRNHRLGKYINDYLAEV